jgi:hypothetical protein
MFSGASRGSNMGDRVYAKVQTQQKTLRGSSSKGSLLQRKCACGQHTIASDECEACRSEQATLQRSQRTFGPPSAPGAVQGSSPAQENGTSFNPSFDRASHFGHDFSRIPIHRPVAGAIQTKLAINKPGDHYEQEADRISEQVMRMPEPQLQRACTCGGACPKCQTEQPGQEHERLQTKHVGSSDSGQAAAPPIVYEVLASPGRPLDAATRAFVEPRFGHDFSHVRVHTDATAAQSAEAVNAQAYAVGRDLVFARGQYAPGTARGRHLLAHELAHVVQQEGGLGTSVVQRAEVDDRSCAGLKDIESDIDTVVNKEIDDERKSMGKPIYAPLLSLRVMNQLGGRTPVSPIEVFIEGLPATKRNLPPNSLVGTKYSGVEDVNRFYKLQTLGLAHVVGSAAKIHGICVGADKLGHFFAEGYDYFQAASKPGSTAADIENLGRAMETGIYGLGATGVFSNADLAANRAGMKFYKDLEKHPDTFKFRIKDYITSQWNEQANPSFYKSEVGSVVWSNLLNGPWQGEFISTGKPIKTKFDLSSTVTGSVTGTFELLGGGVKPSESKGTIKSGTISQRTTSIPVTSPSGPTTTFTPVSGISIEFEWERGTMSGKGRLDSVNEQTLNGTLGTGSSITGSGIVKLKKV